MSKVLKELAASTDGLERGLARVLRYWQNSKAANGKDRRLGYEPRDIKQEGARKIIARRVMNQSSGFDEVPAEHSYEALVLEYPDEFDAEVLARARSRLHQEAEFVGPTADLVELNVRVDRLLDRATVPFPKGTIQPQRIINNSTTFLRDPSVVAYILHRAKGTCEGCGGAAPFETRQGRGFLEVHHMKRLAEGGSDRVQNAVALCPNCHRAMHYAANAVERADRLYSQIGSLVRE